MAAKTGITIRGLGKLTRQLRKLEPKNARKAIRKAARAAAKPVQIKAKDLAPVDTGLLRKEIKVRAVKRSRQRIGVRVTIGNRNFVGDTFYGGFQEFGWTTVNGRRVPGKHFLEAAADDNKSRVREIFKRELAIQIRELTR
jgi:HK97 gp10 family phage protein